MKDLTITAIIKVYQYDELNEADRSLMKTAMEATARSYAPYSHFSVGAAALLNNGTIVTGTNQENAAYPSGLCAERTTLFYANSQYPDQPVNTLAIAARTEKDFIETPIPPCGACRQVILETEKRYGQPIRILLYGRECIYEVKSIGVGQWETKLYRNGVKLRPEQTGIKDLSEDKLYRVYGSDNSFLGIGTFHEGSFRSFKNF